LLEGRNVNLRVAEKEDIPLLAEWWNSLAVNGDYEFFPQMSKTEMEKEMEKLSAEPSLFATKVFLIEKKDGSKIGYLVHYPAGRLPEIGYAIVPSERGKGYCTEAAKMMVDYLFLSKDIARVQAHTDVRNVASQRVLEKVGFKKEGVARSSIFVRGEWRDRYLLSILREEWESTFKSVRNKHLVRENRKGGSCGRNSDRWRYRHSR
jgi:RimJ/RimL family protein N-acetyltransferase